jgi:hypothetical protein
VRPVGFDTSTLSVLLNPHCRIPIDPATGVPVTQTRARVEILVHSLNKARQRIIPPTPVIAELLTAIGPTAQEYVDIVARSRVFEIAAFDERAAVELAILNRGVFARQDDPRAEPYQKIKIDRQILAIMKSRNVEVVYIDDRKAASRAQACGLKVVHLHELMEPAQDRQMRLALETHDDLPPIRDDV